MSGKVNKIQEFMSNQGNVNCAKWGKGNNLLIATGGQDRKVNIWKLGCPNIVAQLHGHTSTIESVTFGSDEEMVVSGSSGGTIKVWDLNSERVHKSYNYGHKTNVTSLDYHPFGKFFCSGSTDTQVKVWDLRKKTSLQTYKGHTKAINVLRFSPDGRWVVSGGGDGIVKLWDLTAGKQMEDFTRHQGEITSLDFHPTEFLLAVGSADRTVTFWDLDKFKQVSQTPADTRPVRCIRYTPDGSALCTASSDSLKLWGWEPVACHDVVHDVNWQNVADMHVNERNGELYGVSFVESFVSVWMVPLQMLHPFSKNAKPSQPPPTPAPVAVTAPMQLDGPVDPQQNGQYKVTSETRAKRISEIQSNQDEIQKRFGLTEAHHIIEEQNKMIHLQQAKQREQEDRLAQLQRQREHEAQEAQQKEHDRQKRLKQEQAATRVVPANMSQPLGLNMENFTPKQSGKTDSQLAESLLADHSGMQQMLTQRLGNIQVLKSLWFSDKRGAVQHVQHLNDSSISVDFLKLVQKTREREMNLDLALGILPVVSHVLRSTYETHLVTGLEAASTLWHAFGDLVTKTLNSKSNVVDVSLEERKDKCRIAKNLFGEVRHVVGGLKDRKDDVGNRSKLLWRDLPADTFD